MRSALATAAPEGESPGQPDAGDILVVGYGNTLRQDDGVGPRVAERIAALGLPGVRTLALAQLSPEHVEEISRSRLVVFVDAAAGGDGPMDLQPIGPAESSQVTTHAVEPATLLAMARDLFGGAPRAWLLTIRAEMLGFGEEFSSGARLGVETAVADISNLVRSRGNP